MGEFGNCADCSVLESVIKSVDRPSIGKEPCSLFTESSVRCVSATTAYNMQHAFTANNKNN